MTIKPNLQNYCYIFTMVFCLSILDIVILLTDGISAYVFLLCITLPPLWIILRFAVAIGKTVSMDRDGCTISFLCYRKKYRWDDLSVKQMENSKKIISYKRQFNSSAFFSVRPVKRPKWMGPCEYCTFFRPFSCFFVTFNEDTPKESNLYPAPYCVDKGAFLDTLALWEVHLDHVIL